MRKFCLADKTVNSFVIAVYMPMMCWRNGVLVNWKNDDLFSHRKNCRVFVEYPVSFSPLGASGFRLPLQRGNGKRLSSFPVRGAGSGCRPDTAIARFPGWLTAPGRGRKAGLHLPFAATRAGNRFRFVPGGGDAIRFSGRGTGRSGTRSHPESRPVLARRKPLAKLDIFGYSL